MDLHKTCKALGMLLLKALDKNVCRRVCTQWHEQGQKKLQGPTRCKLKEERIKAMKGRQEGEGWHTAIL